MRLRTYDESVITQGQEMSKRKGLAAIVCGTIAVAVTVIAPGAMATAAAPTGTAPAPTSALSASVICSTSGNVVIMYYKSAVAPTSNGCWTNNRPLGADLSTFKTCDYLPLNTSHGTGSLYIYDDVSSGHTSPTDYNYLTGWCPFGGSTSIWAEFMAANGGNWTTIPGVSATRYYQELYSGGRDVYSPQTIAGHTPVPVVNVGYDVANGGTSEASWINHDISLVCHYYTDPPPGTVYWVSLYSNVVMTSTDVGYVNTALNNCYHP
jgi:hypothetical protein